MFTTINGDGGDVYTGIYTRGGRDMLLFVPMFMDELKNVSKVTIFTADDARIEYERGSDEGKRRSV